MLPRIPRFPQFAGLVFFTLVGFTSLAAAQTVAPVLAIDGLGKGIAPLDGPWQFHVGDNLEWALPQTGDGAGNVGWEQISPDKTWGAQGHPSYTGYAWYRKHLHIQPAPGAPPDFALLIRHIDDAYEIYWNGTLIGHHGNLPPHPSYPYSPPAQTFGMGPARDGVLALRVWKAPLTSFDSDHLGGLYAAPLVGSPTAIAAQKAELDYGWLRSRQYYFGLESLNALVMVLSLLAWLRDRSKRVLFWHGCLQRRFCAFANSCWTADSLFLQLCPGLAAAGLSLADVGLWFLLLYLLKLDENPRLARITRQSGHHQHVATSLDGLITLLDWSKPLTRALGADGRCAFDGHLYGG